ncbi:MAG: hypothetical protein KA004_03080 [Verrucomicrobiales bacterium]|nr:hypothetical protein [Verrucomicrobiales bacterium]
MPSGGMFAGKTWHFSPEPFPLELRQVEQLRRLGHRLHLFLSACNAFYHRSLSERLPPWIADYLDRGKPADLLDLARAKPLRGALPGIIRPDLLLTEDGFALTEIDSVPGGIGLTAWLGQTYAEADTRWEIVGGHRGMAEGFSSLFPRGADIAVSKEAGDYFPEMRWLAQQLNGPFEVVEAETYAPRERDIYRFFELFDLPNIRHWRDMLEAQAAGRLSINAPIKPWLEEKLWLALFWSRPLRDLWRRELRENQRDELARIIPRSWIVDPAPVPHHAVIPGLDITTWEELAGFTQQERHLVLKLSGFSQNAWGSRSVVIGHDVSHDQWRQAVQQAMASFPANPYVLQRFHKGRLVQHPYYDSQSGQQRILEGRVRLCPYYFAPADGGAIQLGGVLATICPADKKIIHGMEDAVIVPCRVAGSP